MKKLSTSLIAGATGLVLVSVAQAGPIDVVMKIDESGSMGPHITTVKENVVTIFKGLPAGSHVGLVGYGTYLHGGGSQQIPHIHTAVTSDEAVFQAAVDTMVASGGIEQGYRAVYESATDTVSNGSLGFTGAPYCNVLISDETLNQGGNTQQEAIDAMVAAGGIFFGIIPTNLFAETQPLADATGGQLFDLAQFGQDPNNTPVLDALLAACVEAASPVVVDIKPGSCPNPFKLRKRGVMPIAILGSDTFDVATVDPESVELHVNGAHVPGCAPIRWAVEDVATPYDGPSEELDENNCTELEADGYADLTLKFDSQCLATAVGGDTGVVLWKVTGQYDDAGTPTDFEAEDVVRVME